MGFVFPLIERRSRYNAELRHRAGDPLQAELKLLFRAELTHWLIRVYRLRAPKWRKKNNSYEYPHPNYIDARG